MILPKLLARVFTGYALEDLGAAWVLVLELCLCQLRPFIFHPNPISPAIVRNARVGGDGEWRGGPGHLAAEQEGMSRRGKERRSQARRHTSNVINTVINNDVKALLAVVLLDLCWGELFGHFDVQGVSIKVGESSIVF